MSAMAERSRRFVATLLVLCAGPLAWAAHLAAVYGTTAVVCARPELQATGLLPPLIGTVTAVALAVAGWSLVRGLQRWSDRGDDLDAIAAALAGFAAVAIAWGGLPAVVVVPACG